MAQNTVAPIAKHKLRIPVRGTNRKFYLVPPVPEKHRPEFYVRFDVPRDLRMADPKLPKTVLRSTGTSLLEPARLRAAGIIEAILGGRWQDSEQMKIATSGANIGDVLDRYRPSPRDVKPGVANRNKNSLLIILREVFPRATVRDLRASEALTAQTLRKWIAQRKERFTMLDFMLQEQAAITLNSTLAMARSVVSPKVRELYADLKLPDLAEFYAVPKLAVDKHVGYRALPPACLEQMEAAAELLRRGDYKGLDADGKPMAKEMQGAVYLVYLLMSRLGLRNNEVFAARWSWIERHPDGSADFVIQRRADFVVKNKHCGRLDIDPELLTQIDQERALPDAWIIPGATKTDRYEACYRHINAVLRPLMPPGRDKAAYELRKHAGSVIVSRPESEGGGIVAAAAFLRDTIATTEKHYATFLRKIRGIRTSELSTPSTIAA